MLLGKRPKNELERKHLIVPACAGSRHGYVMWLRAAKISQGTGHEGYCTDCTTKYQQEMARQSRCTNPDLDLTNIKESSDETI